MLKEQELQFIHGVLEHPPSQTVEEAGSEIHESNRFPDPYIFIFKNRKLYTPRGIPVEEKINKSTYRGILEDRAFQQIQKWGSENDQGITVWFSPRYPGVDTSKFIFSEILAVRGEKILFNRAVDLDIDAVTLLHLANSLSIDFHLDNPEDLRTTPAFPTYGEFINWFENLAGWTHQISMVKSGQDILLKTDTYANLTDIQDSVKVYGNNSSYNAVLYKAKSQGLIGPHSGSCPSLSAFEAMYADSRFIGEVKKIDCNCGFCKQRVTALIFGGRIYCPSCKRSAPVVC